MVRAPVLSLCLLVLLATGLLATQSATSSLAEHLPANAEAVEAQVRQAEERRLAAMTAGDLDALETLLDDCLRYGHSNGTVDTKESLLERLRSGRVDYRAIEPAEMEIHLHGPDLALVTARARFTVAQGERVMEAQLRYTATWTLFEGRWVMVGYQSARVG